MIYMKDQILFFQHLLRYNLIAGKVVGIEDEFIE